MKLAKLSLAAIVVAGLASSSFAADTLADAFKEGKVSGALKSYYFDKDDGTDSEGILNFGLMLNYKTGSLYGFSANFTGQTNHAPFATTAQKDMFDGMNSEYGSGAQLSEAYIAYTGGKTTVLVGRMFLDTPLVASSGSRIVKEAFEGAAVINTDLPNTTLIAGYVQKFQSRTDGAGNIGTFERSVSDTTTINVPLEDGAYTVAAINKSIAGLTLTAAYADAINIAKIVYAEAAYEGKASNFTYGLAAQYYHTSYDSSISTDNASLYGVKATLGMGAVTGYVAYTSVSKDMDVTAGLGGGADLAYTGSVILSNSYAANTDAYKVGIDYAINAQATIGATYTITDDDDLLGAGNGKISYISLLGSYDFTGALKGFGLGAEYDKGNHDKAGVKDDQEIRIKATYKF